MNNLRAFTVLFLCFSSFALCQTKVPTCENAIQAIIEDVEENGSGDCAYYYTSPKVIAIDYEKGIIRCEAVQEQTCPYMPEENSKEIRRFDAKYGISVNFLD